MGNDCDIDFVNFFALNARVLESMIVLVKTNNEEFLASQREKLIGRASCRERVSSPV